MKIRCNRLFNLLNKHIYNKFQTALLIVIFLAYVIQVASSDGFALAVIFSFFILLIYFSLFALLTIFDFQKALLVDEERIEYSMRLCEDYKDRVSFIVTRPHRFSRLAHVSNSEIKEIIYSSSKLEKLFNVGHIQIVAKTYITDKKGEPFYIFDTSLATLIYGIRDFKNVKLKLEKALPNTKHIEK